VKEQLLTRDKFRQTIFERDNYKCVNCGNRAQDAHHIMERRLFDDGGYYVDNGASLCGECHIKAEQTLLSCEKIRESANIENIILPSHLYKDQIYDKWGNIIIGNGKRLRGELFNDLSVRKVLFPVLNEFVDYVKYPRTYHLPWSPSYTKDDRVLNDISHFIGKRVIVTAKMDGENTTMYSNYIHARSIDSDNHISRNWVKNLQSRMGYNIPNGWRICGENLYAKHSIHYQNLEDYFLVFSIWNEKNVCLSWDETLVYCELLGLKHVPIFYDGLWNEKIRELYQSTTFQDDELEGYVIRIADEFSYGNFRKSIAKYVRKNHIQDVVHNWKHQPIVQNKRWIDNNKVRSEKN